MTMLKHWLTAAAVLAVVPTASAARFFHIELERSQPAADSTVRAAPTEIRLWFSERVQLPVTTVQLIGPDSARVALGRPTQAAGAGAPVVVTVQGPMRAGVQRVVWRTMARDGHVARGAFTFMLAGASPAR